MSKALNIKYILLIAIVSVSINGCIIVKKTSDDNSYYPTISLSPKPEIPMSDELVRSTKGDMIALIPRNWFFVDVEEKVSSDIIAIAVNPDYTLSAVFSTIKKSDRTDTLVAKEGLYGLARLAFSRRERKTAGSVHLIGKYQQIEMGPQKFVKYEFVPSSSGAKSKAAVFESEFNQYYEFAIVPMNVKGLPAPAEEDVDKIFRSILSTIKL